MTITINGSGTITGATTLASAAAFSSTASFAGDVTLAGSGVEVLNNSGRIVVGQTGSIIQTLQVVKTNIFSSSTSGFVDVTGLTLDITPTSTSSKVLVICTVSGGAATSNLLWNLVRNGTNIAQSTAVTGPSTSSNGYPTSYNFLASPITFLDSPASTSAVTYKIQMNASGNTAYVNARANDNYYGGISQITLMEIAQ